MLRTGRRLPPRPTRFLLSGVIVVLAAALLVRLPHESPEERFWHWFAANEELFFASEQGQEPIFDELQARLGKIDPDLTFLFGPKIEGKREFFVTADGKLRAFPAVWRIVEAAPPLERWAIAAFRPKMPDAVVKFRGLEVSPRQVVFSAAREGSRIGVSVFLPDRVAARQDAARTIAWLILDTVLGERDLATKIGSLAVFGLSQAQGLRTLTADELPGFIDWRLSFDRPAD